MKREINCADCAESWFEIANKKDVRAAGEKVFVTAGNALRDYQCDGCGEELLRGATCFAVSVYAADQELIAWEDDYITLEDVSTIDLARWLQEEKP